MTLREAKEWAREIHPDLCVAATSSESPFLELRFYTYGGRWSRVTWSQVGVCRSMKELHTALRFLQAAKEKKIFS